MKSQLLILALAIFSLNAQAYCHKTKTTKLCTGAFVIYGNSLAKIVSINAKDKKLTLSAPNSKESFEEKLTEVEPIQYQYRDITLCNQVIHKGEAKQVTGLTENGEVFLSPNTNEDFNSIEKVDFINVIPTVNRHKGFRTNQSVFFKGELVKIKFITYSGTFYIDINGQLAETKISSLSKTVLCSEGNKVCKNDKVEYKNYDYKVKEVSADGYAMLERINASDSPQLAHFSELKVYNPKSNWLRKSPRTKTTTNTNRSLSQNGKGKLIFENTCYRDFLLPKGAVQKVSRPHLQLRRNYEM